MSRKVKRQCDIYFGPYFTTAIMNVSVVCVKVDDVKGHVYPFPLVMSPVPFPFLFSASCF